MITDATFGFLHPAGSKFQVVICAGGIDFEIGAPVGIKAAGPLLSRSLAAFRP